MNAWTRQPWTSNNKKRPRPGAINSQKGKQYEDFALAFLRQQGLGLIERNYRCRCGEVDLLMRDGDMLVFVEVKFRRQLSHGTSVEQVTWSKQQKLLKSAMIYLAQHRQWQNSPWRLDIVGIHGSGPDQAVQWIQNALEYD